MAKNLKVELKRLAKSELVGNISKQLTSYETRVKSLVKDFEGKSRDAREKSRGHLDKLSTQLKATRSEVEKKVSVMWSDEAKRLNKGMGDLLSYLKSVAHSEKIAAKGRATAKKVSTKAPKSYPPASSTTTKKGARKVKSAPARSRASSAT